MLVQGIYLSQGLPQYEHSEREKDAFIVSLCVHQNLDSHLKPKVNSEQGNIYVGGCVNERRYIFYIIACYHKISKICRFSGKHVCQLHIYIYIYIYIWSGLHIISLKLDANFLFGANSLYVEMVSLTVFNNTVVQLY